MAKKAKETVEIVGRAKGGVARAESLSKARRKQIAQEAASARWDKANDTPKADYIGKLEIGELSIPCAVLPDGTRVLSQRGVGRALGRGFGGKSWKKDEDGAGRLPFYINAPPLIPFIPKDLLVLIEKPILYRHGKGGGVANGLAATALPLVCNVWLKAREAGKLNDAQLAVAQRAEIVMRGLAHTGIIALVDEATGFQYVRASDALARILSEFIDKELQPYASTFTPTYYSEIFRLRGMDFPKDTVQRPRYFGVLTNEIIYRRLAPGVLEELKRVTPKLPDGRHKDKLFRRLTQNKGYPALKEHLGAVQVMMQLSTNWHDFMAKLDKLKPRLDIKSLRKAQQLSFDYDAAADNGKGI